MTTAGTTAICLSPRVKSLVDRSKYQILPVLILLVFFVEFFSFSDQPRTHSFSFSTNNNKRQHHHRIIAYPNLTSPHICNNDTAELDPPQPYNEWLKGNNNNNGSIDDDHDHRALCAAHHQSLQPIAQGTPQVAFLFITRGAMPLEPLWRTFFQGHEEHYSLYVHATNETHEHGRDSIFYNRTIPSRPIDRYQISFCEAVRRLVAYALLDSTSPNAWFTVVGDATLPVRPFSFVYTYITNSNVSFVESFASNGWRRRGGFGRRNANGLPDANIRKGEPWVTLHRRHAGMLVGDATIFPKFKNFWAVDGIPSEYYIATLFSEMEDPSAFANRSLMFVNWMEVKDGHPTLFSKENFGPEWLGLLQRQSVNTYGFFYREYRDVMPSEYLHRQSACEYNGVAFSPCYLFARKFSHLPEDLDVFRKFLGPVYVAADGAAEAQAEERLLRPALAVAEQ